MTVTVCIPTIPPRAKMLKRAVASVLEQTRPADAISIATDLDHAGAAPTRNRAWHAARTEWVAFLDDDDELAPDHLEHLLAVQADTGADVVYPWHRIIGPDGRQLPDLLGAQGVPFDADGLMHRNWIPVTVLVRTSLLWDVGGFPVPGSEHWAHEECEDWGLWRRLVNIGAQFVHTPRVTWQWNHHGLNTSGRGDRWPGTKAVFS